MPSIEVNLPPISREIAPAFQPLLSNRDRYLILYGGRGSTKSVFTAKKLIWRCLTAPYFRFLLIRRNYNTIKESQYQTIKDIIEEWGLESLFTFKLSPLEIVCVNGNRFICRGCDDPKKIKSTKDPSGAWYEEDIIEEDDWYTITTSIRTSKADYLQEVFTINPEVEGRFDEHWFYKRFFGAHPGKLSFSANTTIQIGDGKEADVSYTVHHSTHKDNPWLPAEFRAFLVDLQAKNPYYYTIYTLGQWGTKEVKDRFYPAFSHIDHVVPKPLYRADLPLHVTNDFNTKPHNTTTIWQFDETGTIGTQIDEICLEPPNNRDEDQIRVFMARYGRHPGKVYIYGDPSGQADDTKQEYGDNRFVRMLAWMRPLNTELRVQTKAPSVEARGDWKNAILKGERPVTFRIGENCTRTISDYLNLRSDPTGGKDKSKVKNSDGDRVEPYGHCTDANEYLLTVVWAEDYTAYRNRFNPPPVVRPGKPVNRMRY